MNFIGPYSDIPYGAYPISRPSRHTDIRKIAPATGFPISLDDVKADLRVDSSDEDPTIKRMMRAAAEFLEGRTGCSVLAGRYEANFNEWCLFAPWEFHRWPLREVLEIAWIDVSQSPPTWVSVDLGQFMVSARSKSFLVQPLTAFVAPPLYAPFSGIRVRFVAGFDVLTDQSSGEEQVSEGGDGDDGEAKTITDRMRTLLTMLVAHYYQNRELFLADKQAEIEASAGSLIASERKYW